MLGADVVGRPHFLYAEPLGDQPDCVVLLPEGEQGFHGDFRTGLGVHRTRNECEGLGGTEGDFFEAIRAVTHNSGVIGQAPEFVRLDPILLHPLIRVGRMVQMHGPGGTLNPVFP